MNASPEALADQLPLHPYYPLGTVLPDYVANTISVPGLLACFAAGSGGILLSAYLIVKTTSRPLTFGQTLAMLWFVLCGFIHFFFEGKTPASQSTANMKWPNKANNDVKATLPATTSPWPARATSSASSGRSTPSPTRAT
jgi:hypothetical protein